MLELLTTNLGVRSLNLFGRAIVFSELTGDAVPQYCSSGTRAELGRRDLVSDKSNARPFHLTLFRHVLKLPSDRCPMVDFPRFRCAELAVGALQIRLGNVKADEVRTLLSDQVN